MNEEQMVAEVLHGEAGTDSSRYALYENGTYMVISKFAYLIGVPTRIFVNEYEPPKMVRETPAGQKCPCYSKPVYAAHSP